MFDIPSLPICRTPIPIANHLSGPICEGGVAALAGNSLLGRRIMRPEEPLGAIGRPFYPACFRFASVWKGFPFESWHPEEKQEPLRNLGINPTQQPFLGPPELSSRPLQSLSGRDPIAFSGHGASKLLNPADRRKSHFF